MLVGLWNIKTSIQKIWTMSTSFKLDNPNMEVVNELNLVNHCLVGGANWCTPSSTIDVQKSASRNCSRGSDIFASSKFGVEHDLNSIKAETDYNMEYSSSDIVRKVLKRCHLKRECFDVAQSSSIDIGDIVGDAGSSLSCKVCCSLDNPSNMLICDLCEEAFHMSCFKPRIKKIPIDEWYCKPCMKKKPKPLLRVISSGKSLSAIEEKYINISSRRKHCPISSMLEDTEPYTTGVRIGKAFQADVPDWSGPISNKGDNDNSVDDWDRMLAIHLNEKAANYGSKAKIMGDKEVRMIIEDYQKWKHVWTNELEETVKDLWMALIEAFSQRFEAKTRTMQNKCETIQRLSSYIHMTELMVDCRSLRSGMADNEEFIAMFCSLVNCLTGRKNVVDDKIATTMSTDPASQFKHDVEVSMIEPSCIGFDTQVQRPNALEGKTMEKLKNCEQKMQDSKTKAQKMKNSIEQLWKKRRIV